MQNDKLYVSSIGLRGATRQSIPAGQMFAADELVKSTLESSLAAGTVTEYNPESPGGPVLAKGKGRQTGPANHTPADDIKPKTNKVESAADKLEKISIRKILQGMGQPKPQAGCKLSTLRKKLRKAQEEQEAS